MNDDKAEQLAKRLSRLTPDMREEHFARLRLTAIQIISAISLGEYEPEGWCEFDLPPFDEPSRLQFYGIPALGGYEKFVKLLKSTPSNHFGWAVFITGRLGGSPPADLLNECDLLHDDELEHVIMPRRDDILSLTGVEAIAWGDLVIKENRVSQFDMTTNCKTVESDMRVLLNGAEVFAGKSELKYHHLHIDEIVHGLNSAGFNPCENNGKAGWIPLITDWLNPESARVPPRYSKAAGTGDYPTEILLWQTGEPNERQ